MMGAKAKAEGRWEGDSASIERSTLVLKFEFKSKGGRQGEVGEGGWEGDSCAALSHFTLTQPPSPPLPPFLLHSHYPSPPQPQCSRSPPPALTLHLPCTWAGQPATFALYSLQLTHSPSRLSSSPPLPIPTTTTAFAFPTPPPAESSTYPAPGQDSQPDPSCTGLGPCCGTRVAPT